MVYVHNSSAKGNKSHCFLCTDIRKSESETLSWRRITLKKQVGTNDQDTGGNTLIFIKGKKY